jgi:hypothetical protein
MSTPTGVVNGVSNDLNHVQAPGLLHEALTTASTRSSSEVSLHRVKNLPGYTTPVFKGKNEQRAKVQASVAAKVSDGFFNRLT